MTGEHYKAIYAVLFEAGRHDLITALQNTTGAHMAGEIERLQAARAAPAQPVERVLLQRPTGSVFWVQSAKDNPPHNPTPYYEYAWATIEKLA
jgi:hypothetical protein